MTTARQTDDKPYEQIAQSLEAQYSLLDPALVRALLYECDYNDVEQSRALHDTLGALRAQAAADDASSFDPSGTSGGDALVRLSPGKSTSEGWEDRTESCVTTSSDTDLTNLSHDLANAGLGDCTTRVCSVEKSSDLASDEASLLELFPSQTETTISYILKKCDGSFDRAVDVLLNHVYFDEPADGEERISLKGIDAFEQAPTPRGRKRKGKKKHNSVSIDSTWPSSDVLVPTTAPANHWQSAARDVDFLVTRTGLSQKSVQSLYNGHGSSVPATIKAIVEQGAETCRGAISDDPLEDINIATLASTFEAIPLSTVAGLIRVTAPSTAHAHDLAKALIAPSPRAVDDMSLVGRKLVPQYAPLRIDEDFGSHSSSATVLASPKTLSATALTTLRSNAFNSASQYHRKAGSDRYFGGAAAYYGQLGRDYSSQLHAATSAEADAIVSGQSSAGVMDLHGVSVADAVRIAEERTRCWWDTVRFKEGRSNSERIGEGFVIVTGRGIHSKGGRGRLGPAVTKALMSRGWKVEVRLGEVVVRGKVRK